MELYKYDYLLLLLLLLLLVVVVVVVVVVTYQNLPPVLIAHNVTLAISASLEYLTPCKSQVNLLQRLREIPLKKKHF